MKYYRYLKSEGLLIWLVSVLLLSSCSVSHYEIISAGSKGDFIQSPSVALKLKPDNTPKNKYYYVIFYGISNKYQETIDGLSKCESWSGNTDYFPNNNQPKLEKKLNSQKTGHLFYVFNIVSTKATYSSATLNREKNIYFLQFDYNTLTQGAATTVTNNFNQLANDLLVEVAGMEGTASNNWVVSTCQNMVESIWELVPIPQTASLGRFAYKVNDKESSVLLSPKIAIKVDHQNIYSAKASSSIPDKWNYNLEYQSIITFYKADDGSIKQSPFLNIEKNTAIDLPSNSPIDKYDASENLQTSSADLQLSANTNKQNFICLFQNYMKSNIYSSEGTSDMTINKNDDLYIGNSVLLLNKKLDLLLARDNSNVKATFGSGQLLYHKYSRTLITPVIYVFVNGNLVPIILGSTIGMLNQYYNIGTDFSCHRQFKGKYYKMKSWNSNTLLLPGDKISF